MEDKEMAVEDNRFIKDDFDWVCIVLLMFIFGFGYSGADNARVNELEKKVARLEGQMSMLGGKTL